MRKLNLLYILVGCTFSATYAQSQTFQGFAIPALQESSLLEEKQGDEKNQTTFTDSANADASENSNQIFLTGQAQVRQPGMILKADTITYNKNTQDLEAQGHARLLRSGSLITAPYIIYNTESKAGEMTEPEFDMSNGAVSHSELGTLVDDDHVKLKNAFYTACHCEEPSWYIKAKDVDLYNDENEGVAKNGALYIKGVPIFWSPWLTFPVKAEKKSGWLAPMFGYTSRSGYDLQFPYFINLAPNYDLTLTPRLLSKRGFVVNGEFRYLMPSYSGKISGEYIPHDNLADRTRWSYSIQHNQNLGEIAGLRFGLHVDWNKVSDDDYYRDINKIFLNESEEGYLNQSATLSFSGYKYWHGSLRIQKYQGLHDAESKTLYLQYEKVPELNITGERYDWGGFDVKTSNTLTRFVYPKVPRYWYNADYYYENMGGHKNPDGVRFQSYTTVSYPIIRPGWYFTPKVGLHYSYYQTDWYKGYGNYSFKSVSGNQVESQSRLLPILSIDTGMTFERQTTLFGKASRQTLEPELYYVYIPYVNQDDIPVYDTSYMQFGFGSAFSENRFSGGWDRINDANQITLGITSHWYDNDTGGERMAIQLAQRFSFRDQRVKLSSAERLTNRSEFLANFRTRLTDKLSVELGTQYDTDLNESSQSYAMLRWIPKRLASLSLSYRYQRNPLVDEVNTTDPSNPKYYPYQLPGKENIVASGQWPFSHNINAVGRFDYSLRESRTTQAILGVEYNSDCCWTGRVVFQRYAVSKEKANNAVYFQLELRGLGAVGSDPLTVIRDNIPGYQETTVPTPVKTSFERYE